LTGAVGVDDAPRVRSFIDGERRVWLLGLGLGIGLAGCDLGVRGGAGRQAAAKQAVKAEAAKAEAAKAGGGTCEATAAKLVELSVAEGKASGREWSVEVQGKKRDQFIARCRMELPEGKVTRETLLCVEGATVLSQAQACLLAAPGAGGG